MKSIEYLLKNFALLLLGFYRSFLAAFFGGACRFEPTCSDYSRQAFHQHSFLFAFKLTFNRLIKCHPWGPFGYDPVPQKEFKNKSNKRLYCNECK